MKSTMNLYQEQFHPHFIWMTLSHLFVTCVVIGAIVVALDLTLRSELESVNSQLTQKQATLTQQKAVFDEMTDALAKRTEDPELIALLSSLTSNIQGKEALLARLEELSKQQSNSFSEMMTSLAKIDENELWLTRIQVVDNDLSLKGVITSPDALPLWIKRLSDTDYFVERTFREAHISRDQQQLVFSLATKKEGG